MNWKVPGLVKLWFKIIVQNKGFLKITGKSGNILETAVMSIWMDVLYWDLMSVVMDREFYDELNV